MTPLAEAINMLAYAILEHTAHSRDAEDEEVSPDADGVHVPPTL